MENKHSDDARDMYKFPPAPHPLSPTDLLLSASAGLSLVEMRRFASVPNVSTLTYTNKFVDTCGFVVAVM